METKNDGSLGQQDPATQNNEFNTMQFLIAQFTAKMRTVTLVRIVGVDGPIGVAPVGFVDVVPMVNQIDGAGQAVEHITVFNVPYIRIQGAANAVIIDPQVGDIGMCCFASEDISIVKATKDIANPGSKRRFDMADAIYMGGCLNQAPQRYLMIDDSGVTIEGVAKITMHGNDIVITANTQETTATTMTFNGHTIFNGPMDVNNTIHATGIIMSDSDVLSAGTSGHTHVHGGVVAGGSNTSPPT